VGTDAFNFNAVGIPAGGLPMSASNSVVFKKKLPIASDVGRRVAE
jgi:hypothetical protein